MRDGATRGISGIHGILTSLLVETGIEECKLIVVVGDNDGSPDARFGEIVAEIRLAGRFGVPSAPRRIVSSPDRNDGRSVPDIVVLMLPWDGMIGNMESLLYSAAKATNAKLSLCVEGFVTCVTADNHDEWDDAKLAKLKARSVLSASAPKGPDVPIGAAWRPDCGNPFPLESVAFDKVVSYLKTLIRRYKKRRTPK